MTSPTPSTSQARNEEKAMALERPSKVGSSWALNGWGSTSTGDKPPLAKASARVTPAMPAPAMITSAFCV